MLGIRHGILIAQTTYGTFVRKNKTSWQLWQQINHANYQKQIKKIDKISCK